MAKKQQTFKGFVSLNGLRLSRTMRKKRRRSAANRRYRIAHADTITAKRQANADRARQYARQYYALHKQEILARQRADYRRTQARYRKYAQQLRRQGYIVITPDQAAQFLALDQPVIQDAISTYMSHTQNASL